MKKVTVNHSPGMGAQLVKIELQFTNPTAASVKDRIWHPTQILTFRKSGELTMSLTVADNRELVGWILSFGGGMRV